MSEAAEKLRALIKVVPDFPIPGIHFKDIFPLFQDPSNVKSLVNELLLLIRSHINGQKIDVIVGLDARGFLFGPMLAIELGAAFAPVRKKGKLPGATISLAYELEYRKDEIEMQQGSIISGQNVLVVDDLLATGGTLEAACRLVKTLGGKVLASLVVIELCGLGGRARVEKESPVLSLLKYDD